VNATIGAADRASAAEAAAAAASAGFRCLKVKVGIGDDAGRLAAVRAAAGDQVAIRVDANGAWPTPDEALANLRARSVSSLALMTADELAAGIERAERTLPAVLEPLLEHLVVVAW
jgi:L-alanine-DL-glutamate epimerase-like enolase superfamily enzyme